MKQESYVVLTLLQMQMSTSYISSSFIFCEAKDKTYRKSIGMIFIVLHCNLITIIVPSIVWLYKCPKIYVHCAVLIMVAANAKSSCDQLFSHAYKTQGGFAKNGSKEITQCKNVISNRIAMTTPRHLRLQEFFQPT
jgi:hypothetical protein